MGRKKSATAREWVDPDDAPELTEEWFDTADYYEGDQLVPNLHRVAREMDQEAFKIDDPEARRQAWEHARDVLTLPQFVPLASLVQNAATIDEMIWDLENDCRVDESGGVHAHNWQEMIALADFWILGFFEILRIVTGKDYMKVAEFEVGNEFKDLKNDANMVRSSFAKLQVPGRRTYILPSHSAVYGEHGITYAVYDNDGRKIDINRRMLCERFLRLLMRWPPSRSMKELLESVRAKG